MTEMETAESPATCGVRVAVEVTVSSGVAAGAVAGFVAAGLAVAGAGAPASCAKAGRTRAVVSIRADGKRNTARPCGWVPSPGRGMARWLAGRPLCGADPGLADAVRRREGERERRRERDSNYLVRMSFPAARQAQAIDVLLVMDLDFGAVAEQHLGVEAAAAGVAVRRSGRAEGRGVIGVHHGLMRYRK
jgi:hypothetical protein